MMWMWLWACSTGDPMVQRVLDAETLPKRVDTVVGARVAPEVVEQFRTAAQTRPVRALKGLSLFANRAHPSWSRGTKVIAQDDVVALLVSQLGSSNLEARQTASQLLCRQTPTAVLQQIELPVATDEASAWVSLKAGITVPEGISGSDDLRRAVRLQGADAETIAREVGVAEVALLGRMGSRDALRVALERFEAGRSGPEAQTGVFKRQILPFAWRWPAEAAFLPSNIISGRHELRASREATKRITEL